MLFLMVPEVVVDAVVVLMFEVVVVVTMLEGCEVDEVLESM